MPIYAYTDMFVHDILLGANMCACVNFIRCTTERNLLFVLVSKKLVKC